MPFVTREDALRPLNGQMPSVRHPEQAPSLGQIYGAAFRRENLLGAGLGALHKATMLSALRDNAPTNADMAFRSTKQPDFQRYSDMGFGTDLAGAQTAQEYAVVKSKIDQELSDADTLARGGYRGFIANMAAGVLSPENALPVGAILGRARAAEGFIGGFASGLVRGGLTGAAAGGVSELALGSMERTRTGEEMAYNTLSSAVLFGAGGGVYRSMRGGLFGASRREIQAALISGKLPDDATIAVHEKALQLNYKGDSVGAARARHETFFLATHPDAKELRESGFLRRLTDWTFFLSPFGRLLRSKAVASNFLARVLSDSPVLVKHIEGLPAVPAIETGIYRKYGLTAKHILEVDQMRKSATETGGADLDAFRGPRGRRAFNEAVGDAMSNKDEALEAITNPGQRKLIGDAAKRWRTFFEEYKDAGLDGGVISEWDLDELDPSWFHRIWDHDKLSVDSEGFIEAATKYWVEEKKVDPAQARTRAQEFVNSRLSGITMGGFPIDTVGAAGPFQARTMLIPTKYVRDWVKRDIEEVAWSFVNKEAPQLEFERNFRTMVRPPSMEGIQEKARAAANMVEQTDDMQRGNDFIEDLNDIPQTHKAFLGEDTELAVHTIEGLVDMRKVFRQDVRTAEQAVKQATGHVEDFHRAQERQDNILEKTREDYDRVKLETRETFADEYIAAEMPEVLNAKMDAERALAKHNEELARMGAAVGQLTEARGVARAERGASVETFRATKSVLLEGEKVSRAQELETVKAEHEAELGRVRAEHDEKLKPLNESLAKREQEVQNLTEQLKRAGFVETTSHAVPREELVRRKDRISQMRAERMGWQANVRESRAAIKQERARFSEAIGAVEKRTPELPKSEALTKLEGANRGARQKFHMEQRARAEERSRIAAARNDLKRQGAGLRKNVRDTTAALTDLRSRIINPPADSAIRNRFASVVEVNSRGNAHAIFPKTSESLMGGPKPAKIVGNYKIAIEGPIYGAKHAEAVEKRALAEEKLAEARLRMKAVQENLKRYREEAIEMRRTGIQGVGDDAGEFIESSIRVFDNAKDLAEAIKSRTSALRRRAFMDAVNLYPFLNKVNGLVQRQWNEERKALVGKPRALARNTKRMQRDLKDAVAIRDRLLNRDQLRASTAIDTFSRYARRWNHLTLMGGVVLSSFSDAVMPLFTSGFAPWMGAWLRTAENFRENMRAMRKNPAMINQVKGAEEDLFIVGTAGEIVGRNTRQQTLMDVIDAGVTSRGERALDWAARRFNQLALLDRWTALMKAVSAQASMTKIYMIARRYADGGGMKGLRQSDLANLSAIRLDVTHLPRIYEQFNKHGDIGKWYAVARSGAWDADASEALNAMSLGIMADVRQTILTPSAGDIPRFMSDPATRLLRQFTSFSAAATNRIMARGLQQHDSQVAFGTLAIVFMGAFSETARRIASGRDMPEDPYEMAGLAVRASGAAGHFSDVVGWGMKIFGQSMHELATGDAPRSRTAGAEYQVGSTLLGATFGQMLRAYRVGQAVANRDPTERTLDDADALLNPLSGLFYFRRSFDWAERHAAEGLGLKLKPER